MSDQQAAARCKRIEQQVGAQMGVEGYGQPGGSGARPGRSGARPRQAGAGPQ